MLNFSLLILLQTNDGTSDVSIDSIVQVQCEAQLEKMAPVSSTDSAFQTMSNEIMGLVCPNNCNNHGQCIGGKRICKTIMGFG